MTKSSENQRVGHKLVWCSKQTIHHLTSLKIHIKESYDDVLKRLLKKHYSSLLEKKKKVLRIMQDDE